MDNYNIFSFLQLVSKKLNKGVDCIIHNKEYNKGYEYSIMFIRSKLYKILFLNCNFKKLKYINLKQHIHVFYKYFL